MISNRSNNSDLGQHVLGATGAPTVSPEPKQLHQYQHEGSMREPRLENIVIECDYSDMSSDLSAFDDNATFAEEPESRGNNSRRMLTKKPSFRRRPPQMRPDVVPPDHHHEHRDSHHQRQPVRRQASSAADLEAEERKLIEMAMERSLQESSSLMSVSYQSHERGCPSAASSSSSLIGMQSSLRRSDAELKAAAGSGRKVWKRDGKKWARMPASSNNNAASNTVRPGATSAYLEGPMTREERLALVEEQMFDEAMQNSVRGLQISPDDLSSQASNHKQRSYPRQQQHRHSQHHNDTMVGNDHDDHLHDGGYRMSEQAALERLEELERERRKIQSAMVRQRSSRGLQQSSDSGSGSIRQTSYRERPSSGRSFNERDAGWEGNDYRPDTYDDRGRRGCYQESSTSRDPAGCQGDPSNRRQQYHDQHNISLESLSFHNNEQLDNMYEQQQQQRSAPVRKSPPRTQSCDLMSTNSRGSSCRSNEHRFHQSYSNDGGGSSLGHEGRKYVWKRGPNKAWGRYPESEHDEEDEDAIFADVLARSVHER